MRSRKEIELLAHANSESPRLEHPADAAAGETTAEDLAGPGAAADRLSQLLKDLRLDDWEIRSSEIEMMTNRGQPVLLGKGAFGQVQSQLIHMSHIMTWGSEGPLCM